MTQPGPDALSVHPSSEVEEREPTLGILLLKTTLSASGRPFTVELGVITSEKEVDGKKEYNFCRIADLVYRFESNVHDGSVNIIDFVDRTLNRKNIFLNKDGTKIVYKYLFNQDDMIDFLRKLTQSTQYKLKAILQESKKLNSIIQHNKDLLIWAIDIVNRPKNNSI